MECDPEIYNRINGSEQADAKVMIQHILLDGFGTVSTIVDIGCGTGNVTRLLADSISHERVLAIDVDDAMIQFALRCNPCPTVEYLTQDFVVPFDNLDPRIREREGKVDLIWSNRTLHWICEKDRPQIANNILRLLKPDGRAYMNAKFVHDFVAVLAPEKRESIRKVLSIPSLKQQEENWQEVFLDAGATAVTITFEQQSHDEGSAENFQVGRHFVKTGMYRRYLPDSMTLEEKEKFLEPFGDAFLRCCGGPLGKPLSNEELDSATVYYYGLFFIVVTK